MSLYKVTAFSLNKSDKIRNLCLVDNCYLRYDDERVVYSATAKFGYEESENGLGVHLRCLYNNKYLARKAGTNWITATGEKPLEDVESDSCTLFRVENVDRFNMRWVHLASGTETVVGIGSPDHPTEAFYLSVAPGNGANKVGCTPIDMERIIKLPDRVVFKGDNDKYLRVQDDGYLSFNGEDRNRREAWFNIVSLINGNIRVQSVKKGMFWSLQSDGRIKPTDSNLTSDDPNTIFKVARLGDDTIALISLGQNNDYYYISNYKTLFCQRTTNHDLFYANVDTGVKEAGLRVEEPVVSRNIELEYRLDEARIYDVEPQTWLSQVARNRAPTGDLHTTLLVNYTEAFTSTFSTTITVKTNITTSVKGGVSIPFIAKAEVTVSVSLGLDVGLTFGTTTTKSKSVTFSATVVIPPGECRRARIMASQAKCDVPFSYVLTEVSADNVVTRTKLHDGVYKGMNGYDFQVQIYDPTHPEQLVHSEEPLEKGMLGDARAREKIFLAKIG